MSITGKIITPTESTPKVVLDPEGVIVIKGRSLNKNADNIYLEVENWINIYVSNPAELTYVEISFEYFNNVNSKIFNSLLKKISTVSLKNKKVVINWYYEEDDEDMLAYGESISSTLDIPINLVMIPESHNHSQLK
jgi:hypothetical protein